LKRPLAHVVLTLALFACLWVSRVFLSARLVGLVIPEANLWTIALVAALGALLPGVPLGLAYGLIKARPILGSALAIAAGASVLELALASWSVAWWSFVTWWVLPLECVTLMVCFPAAAWAGSALASGVRPVVRRRFGITLFALLALGIGAWPWL
jgi:hypothetical protein